MLSGCCSDTFMIDPLTAVLDLQLKDHESLELTVASEVKSR